MSSILEIKTNSSFPVYDLQCAAEVYLGNFGIADDLEFDDEHHIYYGRGEMLPSVTQIPKRAGMAGVFDTLDPWYATRGQAVHKATELYDLGTLDEDSIDPAISPYFDAYKRFRADTDITIKDVEKRLWCPKYRFAGTIDRLIAGPTSYKLFLLKNGKYRLKAVENTQANFNYFLSALVMISDNHNGAGKDIARMNVTTWIRRNCK